MKHLTVALCIMEEDKDDRVQPLKLIKDKDGSYKIQDRVNVSSSCLCCCVGHCAMSHLTPTVSKSGVTLSHLVTKSPDLEFMYTKEIVTEKPYLHNVAKNFLKFCFRYNIQLKNMFSKINI